MNAILETRRFLERVKMTVRVKNMKRISAYMIVLSCIVFTSSCTAQRTELKDGQSNNLGDFIYTAKLINGQVYLQLNTNPAPDGRIGPFVKQVDGNYTCETKDKGVHTLDKSPDGKWWYGWSYVHSHTERVDASVIDNQQKYPNTH
ncbi:MAG: hypothetical protein A2283_14925 [Lentisphaerae bacterium RIFOXYA12_FULL_48_11]|nr:MAG: hypothetical protein A2283_14925 [Lentisphaerae bacterium RIFOXYA12_FULL_48_11]